MTPRDDRSIAEITALLARSAGKRLRQIAEDLGDDDRVGVREAIDAALARDRARQRERARLKRLYSLEDQLRDEGLSVVVGVDEVGRGSLAGPLTAGACVLPPKPRIEGLNDSKALLPARRVQIAERVREVAICWSVAHVSASEVDSLGMTAALRRVVGRAIGGLELEPEHLVLDGLPLGVFEPETAVVGGDGKVAAIAAASVLAKVTRDALMVNLAETYPLYGFHEHKGYSTPEHLSAIQTHGLCAEHRRSFMPCGGTERLF